MARADDGSSYLVLRRALTRDAQRLARDEYQKSYSFYPKPFTSFLDTSIIGENRKFSGRQLNSGCGRSLEKANLRDLSREDELQVAPEPDLVTPTENL